MFRIKICGITTPGDARLAADAGADAIGINFYAGSKRFVELETAKKIAAALPPEITKVGVFVNEMPEVVREVMAQVPLDFVQFHGDETVELLAEFDARKVIKAFRCRAADLTPVRDYLAACGSAHEPAAALVDAFAPHEYGGTGHALDWASVGQNNSLPDEIPIILAGGLTPDNVAQAIHLAGVFGVDVASGVESSPGVKDADKVRSFVECAQRALGL